MQKKKPLPKFLTQSEKEALYAAANNPRDRCIISLLLNAGLRVSELIHLSHAAVDWDNAQIRFTAKGGKERLIPMNLRLRIDLATALEHRPADLKHELVIWNKRSNTKGVTRFALYNLIRRLGVRAELKKCLHPHMLRHTAATDFYRDCGDIYRTQKFLGHNRIDTTTRYAQLDEKDVRATLENLNRPNFVTRLLTALRTLPPPWLLRRLSNGHATFTGGTIGRQKELTVLKQNLEARVHTVIIGERGVGKTHLLRQLEGEHIYRLDAFRPPRESLVTLCQQLKDAGLLTELPKGRGTAQFISTLREIGRKHRPALIIDDLSSITSTGISELRKLTETWAIIAGLNIRQAHRATEIFFGSHDTLELLPLSNAEARQLAEAVSQDLDMPAKSAFIPNIITESRGNPQAILEMADRARRTNETVIEHPGTQQTLPATPFLTLFLLWAAVSRYAASSIGRPDVKILASICVVILSLVVVFDRILTKGSSL